MTASGENGVASVPAVVTVDNFDGSMIPGTYVSYSFVASESDNCLVVPIQAVKYVSFDNVTLPDTLDAAPSEDGDMYGDMDGMTDGDMMPEDGVTDGDMLPEDGMTDGDMAVSQRYSGGAFAKPLMAVAMPAPDMGGGMDAGMDATGGSGDSPSAIALGPVRRASGQRHSGARSRLGAAQGLLGGAGDHRPERQLPGGDRPGPVQGQVVFLGYQDPNQMY